MDLPPRPPTPTIFVENPCSSHSLNHTLGETDHNVRRKHSIQQRMTFIPRLCPLPHRISTSVFDPRLFRAQISLHAKMTEYPNAQKLLLKSDPSGKVRSSSKQTKTLKERVRLLLEDSRTQALLSLFITITLCLIVLIYFIGFVV